jgi:hypothetical protein
MRKVFLLTALVTSANMADRHAENICTEILRSPLEYRRGIPVSRLHTMALDRRPILVLHQALLSIAQTPEVHMFPPSLRTPTTLA